MLNITVIALIAVNSRGSPRASSLVHQMSHTRWPMIVQKAIFDASGKTKSTNRGILKMLEKCRVPCLIVDSDIMFVRDVEKKLEMVLENINDDGPTLHLCPGCLYNRVAVQTNPDTLWHQHPPEKKIISKIGVSGMVYRTVPFPECWYGGPMAALFTSESTIKSTMSKLRQNMDIPCDVLFTKMKNHHALVEPLCREKEMNQKDRIFLNSNRVHLMKMP